jgi:hypothetical protein
VASIAVSRHLTPWVLKTLKAEGELMCHRGCAFHLKPGSRILIQIPEPEVPAPWAWKESWEPLTHFLQGNLCPSKTVGSCMVLGGDTSPRLGSSSSCSPLNTLPSQFLTPRVWSLVSVKGRQWYLCLFCVPVAGASAWHHLLQLPPARFLLVPCHFLPLFSLPSVIR